MQRRKVFVMGLSLACGLGLFLLPPASAAEEKAGQTIQVGPDLKMTVPAEWSRKTPRVKIVEHEFAIPGGEGEESAGRMTVMVAGGSVEANVERWLGQFTQPDGSSTAEKAKTEKKQVAGTEVTVVDVSGTYRDSRGPFAPAVERPGYRMLAAIVPTSQGNYFIKLYGPKKTIAANEKAFAKMIEGIRKG
ncbi:MAG: hypothetical protein HUU20_22685 [Pirellulales bacterium]|nr:hypothetical protein [Pirellulales bacterium]